MMRVAIFAAFLTFAIGCKGSAKCIERCGKKHHETVKECEKTIDPGQKAGCQERADEANDRCEKKCKK